MQPARLQADLARAHEAYRAGQLDQALRLADSMIAAAPAFAPARQLAAVIARRQGRLEDALGHFEAALRSAPRDPHILNSYANLLGDLGRTDAARTHYRQALLVDPGLVDARVNLAIAAKRAGDLAEAKVELEEALRRAPANARAWQALGVLQVELGDFEAAAEALDATLGLQPDNLAALRARGHVESERGGHPAPFHARARQLAPQDPELALAEALGLFKAGEPTAAEAALEALLAADPTYVEGHVALSRIRWQAGEAEDFTRSFDAALAARPHDPGLWTGYLGVLVRAGLNAEVLEKVAAARPALGEITDRFEAAAASEAGDLRRADAAFARVNLAVDPALQISHLRHLLRAGRPEQVAGEALPIVGRPDGHAAWPYLATAWRLTDQARWNWLEGDPALVRTLDLPITTAQLALLGEALRRLHRSRTAPYDQTLKGGTQTEGDLLARREPEIRALKALLSDAITEYIAALPARDPKHPMLSHDRSDFRFAGSWSVRLQGAGFHMNHVHTTGWISSAFYVALPDEIGASDTAGWLTFGEPPTELGLALPPFRVVEPRPGRLALFPSTLWHGTRPFKAGERLTIAFDVR
ncbi:MAG: hypothetical protein JWO33_1625 [Caulobacteraceae bacterium]|nr:hypothetical protein [Caulobacteraceae bacterium]